MQVEKHLFRIAQKSNKNESAPLCWKTIFAISFILGTIFSIIFVIGEVFIKTNLHQLQNCLTQHTFSLKPDQIGLIYKPSSITPKIIGNNTPLQSPSPSSKYCKIYKNLNTSQIQKHRQVQITSMIALFKMEQKDRATLLFDNYTFVIEDRNMFKEFVYGAEVLFGNQIINMVGDNKIKTIINSEQIFVKSPGLRFSYMFSQTITTFTTRLLNIFSVIFTYAMASIITSLYIYITIIASPALILLFLQLTPFGRTEAFFSAFHAFPWIGMHSLIFRSSSNAAVRQAFTAVCTSLICYFLFMYLGYYKIVLEITTLFFDQPVDAGVGEILFGYFAFIQFAALIFMRTRPFIKYFPIINMLFIFFFMLYCKFVALGFKFPAVLALMFFGISLFSYMVFKLQIEAQQTWNADAGYTPNIKQPRAGLLPTFNLNWINALPDQWTILMPLMGRQHFTNKQLAFVDQNYQVLGQYLNQH